MPSSLMTVMHLFSVQNVLSDQGPILPLHCGSVTLLSHRSTKLKDTIGGQEVALYSSHVIEDEDTVGLRRGGFLLIALLAGGDYDDGIPGCGVSIALGLAKTGLGDGLLSALETLSGPAHNGKT